MNSQNHEDFQELLRVFDNEVKNAASVPKEVKKLECNFCGKTFARSDTLNVHKRSHTGERPYPCTYCNKAFYSSSDLKRHIRTHTKECPYSCEFCNRAFTDRSGLRKHRMTHTGESPFKCDHCNKGFSHRSALAGHIKSKHSGDGKNGNSMSCEQCGIKFVTSVNLENHKNGTGPQYSCEQRKFICDQYYSLQIADRTEMTLYNNLRKRFSTNFPTQNIPHNKTIERIVTTYEAQIGLDNLPSGAICLSEFKKSGGNRVLKKNAKLLGFKPKKAKALLIDTDTHPSTIIQHFQALCAQKITQIDSSIANHTSESDLQFQKSQILNNFQILCRETIKQEKLDTHDDNDLKQDQLFDANEFALGVKQLVEIKVEADDIFEDFNDPESSLSVEFKEETPNKEFGDFLQNISKDDEDSLPQEVVDDGTNASDHDKSDENVQS